MTLDSSLAREVVVAAFAAVRLVGIPSIETVAAVDEPRATSAQLRTSCTHQLRASNVAVTADAVATAPVPVVDLQDSPVPATIAVSSVLGSSSPSALILGRANQGSQLTSGPSLRPESVGYFTLTELVSTAAASTITAVTSSITSSVTSALRITEATAMVSGRATPVVDGTALT